MKMKCSVAVHGLALSGSLLIASAAGAQALKSVAAPYVAPTKASGTELSAKAGSIDDAIGAKPTPKPPSKADESSATQALATANPTKDPNQTAPGTAAQSTAGAATQSTGLPAASIPAPPVPGAINRTWHILPTDGRLATTFERWAKADGMKLVWDAQQHVMLSSSDTFTGTLTEALSRVLTSPAIRLSSFPLEACIYPNNPALLRITRVGDQSQECPQ